jgi:hypothetical protein
VAVTYGFQRIVPSERPVGTSGTDAPSVEPVLAEWKDGRLVTTTIYRVNGMPMTKIESRTLSADGREMTVETQVQIEHGYQSNAKQPQGYIPAKDVYTKAF